MNIKIRIGSIEIEPLSISYGDDVGTSIDRQALMSETEAEEIIRHKTGAEADYAALMDQLIGHPPTSECHVDECNVCGFRDCSNENDAHYYKDGCPDCHGPEVTP